MEKMAICKDQHQEDAFRKQQTMRRPPVMPFQVSFLAVTRDESRPIRGQIEIQAASR